MRRRAKTTPETGDAVRLTPVPPRRPFEWPPFVERLVEVAPDPARLYLVGGIVRDALRGLPGQDFDLATPDDGLQVARHLADALGGAYYPVDAERRTGRVLLERPEGQIVIDVASLRGSQPDDDVERALLADLEGRDFTINAMAVRLDTLDLLIDPLGGQHDLFEDKLLRQCRPTSIREDPIRALRAVRLALQFNLHMTPDTSRAARETAPLLVDSDGRLLQPERARDELFKMLKGPRPAAALRLLHTLGLLEALVPFPLPDGETLEERFRVVERLAALFAIISPLRDDNTAAELILGVAVMVLDRYRRQLQEHLAREFAAGRSLTALLLLGAFTPRGVLSGEAWAEHLHLSKAESRTLSLLERTRHFELVAFPPVDERWMHRYYRATGEVGVDGVLLALAEYLAAHPIEIDPVEWGRLLEEVAAPLLDAFFRRHQHVVAPPPLVTGEDLIRELGLSPGPQIGQILKQLLEEQAAGTIRTKKQALRLAGRLASASPDNNG